MTKSVAIVAGASQGIRWRTAREPTRHGQGIARHLGIEPDNAVAAE